MFVRVPNDDKYDTHDNLAIPQLSLLKSNRTLRNIHKYA